MAAQTSLRDTERLVWNTSSRSDALGQHALWGFSPARDLLDPPPAAGGGATVLLASPGDVRHVLKTIAARRLRGGAKAPVTFLVHETSVELVARHLLLLRVAFDWELPLRQRAAVWLELFGNALVQERTETYVSRLAAELLDLASGGDACDLADVADLGRLKFRDRDVLAAGLQAWRASSAPFDIADLWDRRVRAHLGKRYDAADGSFDWDYRKGLGSAAGGDLVHLKQYRHWRRTGVAFEFGDQTYARPNRTLATFVEGHLKHGKDRGRKKEVRGYWGDMAVGPFAGLGVACDAGPHVDALLEIADKGHATEQRKHNATEVAVYNVLSYLFAIETGAPYAMTRPGDIFSGLGALKDRDAVAHAEHIVESLDGVVFAPLAGPADAALARLAPGSVDAAYLSVNAAQLLESPAFRAALKPGAAVTAEKARLVVPLTDQEKRTFDGKVRDLAKAHGFAEAHDDADAVRFAFAAAAE